MEELKKTVAIQANKLFTENSNSMSIFGTNNSIRGGVDHYDMKPTLIIPSSSGASRVQNYGSDMAMNGFSTPAMALLYYIVTGQVKGATISFLIVPIKSVCQCFEALFHIVLKFNSTSA
ncbi:hypothetical protein Tco_0756759 [Tanacetum coccineum]